MRKTSKEPTSGKATKAKTGAAKPASAGAVKRKTAAPKRAPRKTAPRNAAKPVAAKSTVKKGAPTGAATGALRPAPSLSDAPDTTPEALLRKRALIDAVVTQTGLKKKDVKPVIEATLAQMGTCLAEGRELNLPPFGKLKVKRHKDLPNARVSILRLRQPKRD